MRTDLSRIDNLKNHARGEPYTGAGPSHVTVVSAPVPRQPCIVCGGTVRRLLPYHSWCEPTTCTCDTPRPDGLGECQDCHRLALSHSWHNGRPV